MKTPRISLSLAGALALFTWMRVAPVDKGSGHDSASHCQFGGGGPTRDVIGVAGSCRTIFQPRAFSHPSMNCLRVSHSKSAVDFGTEILCRA